jgi:hypothetical protein
MALETTNPIAQTFSIDSKSLGGLPGVFLTGIGIFFKNKSSTLGAFCVVVQCTNGVPDTSKRMGSGHLYPSQILTSDDASAETIFYFQEPLMLASDSMYAFYVYPDNNTTDFDIWVSEIGGKDTLTGQNVTQQPYSGVLYISSNGDSWTAVQSQDIKFNLYAANFPVSTGKVVFRNDNIDFCRLNMTTGIFRKNSSTPINIGDLVYAANATDFTVLTDTTKFPFGRVTYVDEVAGDLYIRSNGKFTNASVTPASANFGNLRIFRPPSEGDPTLLTETYRIANAAISVLDDIVYNAVVPRFRMNEPIGTAADYSYKGTANSSYSGGAFAKDSNFVKVYNQDLAELRDYERVLRSYSNEVATGSYGTKGNSTYEIDLYTNSQWLSPVIDLSTKTINYITNQINNDTTNEHTRYGSSRSKYISRTVVLDTVAEDLKVWVTGYRPAGTNIYVYAKFLNSQVDSDLFDTKPWTQLEYLNNLGTIFSSPKNFEDYKEYQLGVPAASTRPTSPVDTIAYADSVGDVTKDIPAGTLTYYNSSGALFRGFDTFSIKIVLVSDTTANFPTMRDVRAVALQM